VTAPPPPIIAFLIALSKPGPVQAAWTTGGREAGVKAWPQWESLGDDYDLLVSGTLEAVSTRVRTLGQSAGGPQFIWICVWIKIP
jgi:hypothetical protein